MTRNHSDLDWRPRTPSNPESDRIGITRRNALCLTTLLSHTSTFIVFVYSLWRKLLLMQDTAHNSEFGVPADWLKGEEQRKLLEDDQSSLTGNSLHAGVVGRLPFADRYCTLCFPASFGSVMPVVERGRQKKPFIQIQSHHPRANMNHMLQCHDFCAFLRVTIRNNQVDVISTLLSKVGGWRERVDGT